MNVGIIGYSGDSKKDPVNKLNKICYDLGKLCADNNWTVYNGGRDGIMDIVSESVAVNNGKVVGILPYEEEGNIFLSHQIKTGLDFSMRSYILIKSIDIIVSIGGEIGTAIEILGAYANKKPVILFNNTGGWTDRIKQVLIAEKYLDNRYLAPVYSANNIIEIKEIILKYRNLLYK